MLVESVSLGDPDRVTACFTGRGRPAGSPSVGAAGNLAHRRPHRPSDLARDRASLGAHTATDPTTWQLMRQVHGADVGIVDARTPTGYEHPRVDALVTREEARPLIVQVADCIPLLLAGPSTLGVVHAGRRGVAAGVVATAISALQALGDEPDTLEAVVGPSIGGCCYEVPETLRAMIGDALPAAAAITSWGAPSLDLKAGVAVQLARAGITKVTDVGICTRCDDRFFSHRRDPVSGRQVGMVVRRSAVAA